MGSTDTELNSPPPTGDFDPTQDEPHAGGDTHEGGGGVIVPNGHLPPDPPGPERELGARLRRLGDAFQSSYEQQVRGGHPKSGGDRTPKRGGHTPRRGGHPKIGGDTLKWGDTPKSCTPALLHPHCYLICCGCYLKGDTPKLGRTPINLGGYLKGGDTPKLGGTLKSGGKPQILHPPPPTILTVIPCVS